MKEIELIEKRKPREKHFLQEDGTILAKIYNEEIHYLKNGKYEEIDNTLVKTDTEYKNKQNSYKVFFKEESSNELMKIETGDCYLNIKLVENNSTLLKKIKNVVFSNKNIKYENVIDNIDIEYKVLPSKIKESIILKNSKNVPEKISFIIDTNLNLELNENKSINAKKGDEIIYTIDAPYMIDANNNINNNIYYQILNEENLTKLSLILDNEWFKNSERAYPILIDPTITTSSSNDIMYDTYINSNHPNVNYNSADYLYVGAEVYDDISEPVVYRSLIKFNLPELSTGCEIIDARLNLVGFPVNNLYTPAGKRLIEVHKITVPWSETTATWDNMNDKYDSRVETCFYGGGSYYNTNDEVIWQNDNANITSLVKKWYTNEENYGLMLKASNETGQLNEQSFLPRFFSNANIVTGDNPQPALTITYRDNNGLEDYFEYFTQDFTVGKVSVNSYNGNLVGIFNVGAFKTGKIPTALNIVYNTNDVIAKYNEGYGLGWRTNLSQTITELLTNETLLYVDFDGTTHYFKTTKKIQDNNGNEENITSENTYYDEDGLNITIESYDDKYKLKDNSGTVLEFTKQNTKPAILTKIIDIENNYLTIAYENNKIKKITDSYSRQINISYNINKIIITTEDNCVTLNYNNDLLTSITYGESELTNRKLYLDYNSKNIITAVQYDVYRRVNYEYYSKSPYKVKKISDAEGTYFELNYNNSSTTVIDSVGNVNTFTYNSYGNVCSISNLKSTNFIKSALGRVGMYGESYQEKNKLLSMSGIIGYINNMLTNTSFEESDNIFSSTDGINATIVNECANSGEKSLKITTTSANKYIYKDLSITKDTYYTFSAYIKNANATNIELSLEYTNNEGNVISSVTKVTTTNVNFERYDVSIYYPSSSKSNLKLKIGAKSTCNFYIDDIQLEEGNVANSYNYIDNSDFKNEMQGWTTRAIKMQENQIVNIPDRFEVITMSDGSKVLKIKMLADGSTGVYRSINMPGIQGDNYTISFWYKNEGITPKENLTRNCCLVNFAYKNGQCSIPSINLNPNNEEWQFFMYTFYAEQDYTSISLSIFQEYDANDLYITNISLLKNIKESKLSYDKDGNVVSVTTFDKSTATFNYDKDNKLIQMFDEVGNNLSFEYDENISTRVINGISDLGISNEIKYNNQKLPTVTRISNKIITEITSGVYYIKTYGTNKYLNYVNKELTATEENIVKTNWVFEEVMINEEKYYKIKHTMLENSYLSFTPAKVVLENYEITKSLFKLIRNDNRSYSFKLYNSNKYLTINGNDIMLSEMENNSLSFKTQFYIEKGVKTKFIENSGKYSHDGLALETITDSNLNSIEYDYNKENGKLNAFTNADKITTYYQYENNTDRLLGVYAGEITISNIYNDLGLLSVVNRIVSGKILKSYFYSYDDKKRLRTVRVGNNNSSYQLYTNVYDENTDNLLLTKYSNNNLASYEYDNKNRVIKIVTDDDTYNYYYYNTGNLGKIVSNNGIYKYIYDYGERVKKYIFNDFIANYLYNNNQNLVNIKYNLENNSYFVNYEYGKDGIIKSITNENGTYEYKYDDLGRIDIQKVNNYPLIKYTYIENGKRATRLLRSIKNKEEIYSYKYDSKENVSYVYHNNILEKKYKYDKFNQLIREDNYIDGTTIRTKYNSSGNIVSIKIYKINTYDLIEKEDYKYQIAANEDVLTLAGKNNITYDSCFNPISIGEKITLTWKNKNQLSSYINTENGINSSYSYDKDGLRIKKTVNNIITNYYWCDNKIILEKTNSNILYFIYDTSDNLLGFEYNGSRYSYVRNGTEEIIGILDCNNNYVAKYTYNSWGKILSICDGNNNDVSSNQNHIANINPFLYKSYYYDKETKLYYLKNRYYNSAWHRFINPDSTINNDIFGTNPYIYCSNNPINRKDSNGTFWGAIGIAFTGALVSTAINTVSNIMQGKKWHEGIWGAAASGAVGSLITAYGGAFSAIGAAVVTSTVESVVNELDSYVSLDISYNKKKKVPTISLNQKKELNSKNLYNSLSTVANDIAWGAATGPLTDIPQIKKFVNKIAYFNSGWFKPQKLISGFASKYTIKKSLHELVEGTVDECLSVLLSPTEVSNLKAGNVQLPIIESNCS